MYRVIVSNPAQKRLKEIYDYLTVNRSDTTAKKVRRSLLETAKSLEKMPQRRSILPGTEGLNPPYRYAKKMVLQDYFSDYRAKERSTCFRLFP